MSTELVRYTEPMDTSELDFLLRREQHDRKQYYKAFRVLMIMSFIIPFATAWYRAYDGAPNAFSMTKFFATAGVLLGISTLSTYITYRVHLRKLQLDLRERTKTIETSHITRKLYSVARDVCYFYINSRVKMSIEVTPDDYERLHEGDEISIEYSTHSQLYLGYF
jgi:hypothetical protein